MTDKKLTSILRLRLAPIIQAVQNGDSLKAAQQTQELEKQLESWRNKFCLEVIGQDVSPVQDKYYIDQYLYENKLRAKQRAKLKEEQ